MRDERQMRGLHRMRARPEERRKTGSRGRGHGGLHAPDVVERWTDAPPHLMACCLQSDRHGVTPRETGNSVSFFRVL